MDEVDDILEQNDVEMDKKVEEDDDEEEQEEEDEEEEQLVEQNNSEEDEGHAIDNGEDSDGLKTATTSVGSSEKPQQSSTLDKIHSYYTQMLRSARLAEKYLIYPTAAIPIQTHVNALTMSKGLEYMFIGGEDGYIRKYNFRDTMEGKQSLTIQQKHLLSDSVQNAGILVSYWENEIPQKKSTLKLSKNNKEYELEVSPVYSLAVQSECLFMLSGLKNGGITMQGVRIMEGSISHYFKGHNQVVNILRLNDDETRLISGSWDKKILEWDLGTGGIINEFKGLQSQISALEMRPLYSKVNVEELRKSKDANEADGRHSDEDVDDDMGSLFGDEEEEDDEKSKKEDISKETKDEISKSSLNIVYDNSIFLTSALNGSINIWDRRTPSEPVLSLERRTNIPPWCLSACWSMDGDKIYAGRRNACVEEFDLKMPLKSSHILKLPSISGPVSCIKALPNNRHILCASQDNIRLYNSDMKQNSSSAIPFLIVPGHHGGVISNLYVDPTCRFMVSTSGNRGWQGTSTDLTLIYEIDLE